MRSTPAFSQISGIRAPSPVPIIPKAAESLHFPEICSIQASPHAASVNSPAARPDIHLRRAAIILKTAESHHFPEICSIHVSPYAYHPTPRNSAALSRFLLYYECRGDALLIFRTPAAPGTPAWNSRDGGSLRRQWLCPGRRETQKRRKAMGGPIIFRLIYSAGFGARKSRFCTACFLYLCVNTIIG